MDDAATYKAWALNQYMAIYCDAAHQPTQPLWLNRFQEQLATLTPPNSTPFEDIRKEYVDGSTFLIMCAG
jgi:hypothetical protein